MQLTQSQLPIYCHRSCEKEDVSINIRAFEALIITPLKQSRQMRVWLMQLLENIGETNLVSLKRHVSIEIKSHCMQ